jgi:hypothetical protein
MFNNFSRKSCRLRDNVEKYGRAAKAADDNIIRSMRSACWITTATDTHSEFVILIAFRQQQWLLERASMLRYTYIACLVNLYNNVIMQNNGNNEQSDVQKCTERLHKNIFPREIHITAAVYNQKSHRIFWC